MELTAAILDPYPQNNFVETPYIKDIAKRAEAFIESGFPVHFRGGSGTGKTTMAMHVARKIGRPMIMIHGDEEFSTSDLVGGEHGFRYRKIVDNFIHSVKKTEENMNRCWMDNRLTVACKYGFTLIYDEFTRSRPEANNILLSVLEEKILDLPPARSGFSDYLKVNPNFSIIFTSNPDEYAGVYSSQDALLDRMVTMDLNHFDEETEVNIAKEKSGMQIEDVAKIVKIVRGLRDFNGGGFAPTVRSSIMVSKALNVLQASVNRDDRVFRQICLDVLESQNRRNGNGNNGVRTKEMIDELIDQYC